MKLYAAPETDAEPAEAPAVVHQAGELVELRPERRGKLVGVDGRGVRRRVPAGTWCRIVSGPHEVATGPIYRISISEGPLAGRHYTVPASAIRPVPPPDPPPRGPRLFRAGRATRRDAARPSGGPPAERG